MKIIHDEEGRTIGYQLEESDHMASRALDEMVNGERVAATLSQAIAEIVSRANHSNKQTWRDTFELIEQADPDFDRNLYDLRYDWIGGRIYLLDKKDPPELIRRWYEDD